MVPVKYLFVGAGVLWLLNFLVGKFYSHAEEKYKDSARWKRFQGAESRFLERVGSVLLVGFIILGIDFVLTSLGGHYDEAPADDVPRGRP